MSSFCRLSFISLCFYSNLYLTIMCGRHTSFENVESDSTEFYLFNYIFIFNDVSTSVKVLQCHGNLPKIEMPLVALIS